MYSEYSTYEKGDLFGIKLFKDGNELVGDTQYISASFSDGTYNCIVLTVVQYDAVGNITSISTCSTK